MKMPLVSIVVPVYDAQDYIEKCVKSICAQTVFDIEIILVDDGSTDSSLEICRDLALSDSRIRVFHQENAGDGAARTKGVAEAKGQYIMFADNDDTLTPRAAEILLDAIRENDADMAIGDYFRMKDGMHIRKRYLSDRTVISPSEYFICMSEAARPLDHYYLVLWNKMFRTDIMQGRGLLMKPRGSLNDTMLVIDYLEYAEKIAVAHEPVYEYLYRRTSVLQQFRRKSSLQRWGDYAEGYRRFDSFIRSHLSGEEYEKTKNRLTQYFTREGLPALTVIVPAYNASATLGTCVESILSQTMADLELIIVDDGSTDNTHVIAEEYAEKDRRVKVIRIPHGGVSAARNAALEEIHGEYVMFADADDRIESNAAEKALEAVGTADLVIWDAVYERQEGALPIRIPEEDGIYTSGEYADRICDSMNLAHLSVWNKLFRRGIIELEELYFPEQVLWEDVCFTLDYLCFVKKVRVLREELYHYTDLKGSASYREADEGKKTEVRKAFASCMEHLDRYLLNVDPGSGKYLKRRAAADRRILSLIGNPEGLRNALLTGRDSRNK